LFYDDRKDLRAMVAVHVRLTRLAPPDHLLHDPVAVSPTCGLIGSPTRPFWSDSFHHEIVGSRLWHDRLFLVHLSDAARVDVAVRPAPRSQYFRRTELLLAQKTRARSSSRH